MERSARQPDSGILKAVLGLPEASKRANGRHPTPSAGTRPLTSLVGCRKERATWGLLTVGYSIQSSRGATEAEESGASASLEAALASRHRSGSTWV